MRKFLIYCIVAMMLVASLPAVVSAAASDWEKGNGFHVYQSADPATPKVTAGRVQVEQNSPVTISDADGEYGVKVAHKGYYETGDNWGGVVSKEKFGLNGLKIAVDFEKVPVVDGSDDCWIAIDLVDEPRAFRTNDPYNPGFIDLIRFGRPEIELYGSKGWGKVGQSGINGGDFAVKSGDSLELNVRYELGQYIMTFTHNGTAVFEVPAELTLQASDEVFAEGKAHALVMASCFGVDKGFEYTVNVLPGVPLTEEEVANKAFERAKAADVKTANEAVKEIEEILADAEELAGDSTDFEITNYVSNIKALLKSATISAEIALEATTEEVSKEAAEAATLAEADAKTALKGLEAYIEDFGTGDDEPNDESINPDDEKSDESEGDKDDKADEKDDKCDDKDKNNVLGVVVPVVLVVVVIGIAVVCLIKKKK